jgi:hypothetical protein
MGKVGVAVDEILPCGERVHLNKALVLDSSAFSKSTIAGAVTLAADWTSLVAHPATRRAALNFNVLSQI